MPACPRASPTFSCFLEVFGASTTIQRRNFANVVLSRSSAQEDHLAKSSTITPFMASMPGLDHRILRDVGLDAAGGLVDALDPRLRRLPRKELASLLAALVSRAKASPRRGATGVAIDAASRSA